MPIGKSDGEMVENLVEARLIPDSLDALGGLVSSGATTIFKDDICPIPSPEFPTMALPVAFITGLLGVVLFIKRT